MKPEKQKGNCLEHIQPVSPDDVPHSRKSPTLETVQGNIQIYVKTAQNLPTLQCMHVPSIKIDIWFKVGFIPTTYL